jgi:ribosomal protein S18 acetylase RimI-like enzyme
MAAAERIVRRATVDDLDAVLMVDRMAPIGHERGTLLTQRVASDQCLVCVDRGHVAGYVVITPRTFFERDFIEFLAVSPDFRRTGVASDLLQSAVRRSSTPAIFTSTNRSNLPMRELLIKEGWVFSGQIEGIDEGDPELVFYKRSR